MNSVSGVTDGSKAGRIHNETRTLASESQPGNSKCVNRYFLNICLSLLKQGVVGDPSSLCILKANVFPFVKNEFLDFFSIILVNELIKCDSCSARWLVQSASAVCSMFYIEDLETTVSYVF